MNQALPPMFDLGQTLITDQAFELLVRLRIAPRTLLDAHVQLMPPHAIGVNLNQRLRAIHFKKPIETRFLLPVGAALVQPTELRIVTEAGHLLTTVLLAAEL